MIQSSPTLCKFPQMHPAAFPQLRVSYVCPLSQFLLSQFPQNPYFVTEAT
ncbi:hypothetical protein GCWU000342_00865 [Shuttleworthella satelles DSM 14600]|uniref:Uncharacterized protein n=1 Tax=Shuttleworthella satelles DSM 14600 TaxID=626523 RepID=C4GA53_9FIRM|nr:hypothetical protein GCWU000342_00865 [Shuttleworthia satelles DSM 14600]